MVMAMAMLALTEALVLMAFVDADVDAGICADAHADGSSILGHGWLTWVGGRAWDPMGLLLMWAQWIREISCAGFPAHGANMLNEPVAVGLLGRLGP